MSAATCVRCGEPLPSEAKFCSNCGTSVAETRDTAAQERRVVTVLFADLADSTPLAAALDPERFRRLQAEFFRLASDEVTTLWGRAEKFAGDAVMAVFGLPSAHEDDALRAVRAGLQIRDKVAELGERLALPRPLAVRVGLNSGPVIASADAVGELLVSGVEVNLAARLQEAAEPGEVLAGETTWQLTRDAVEYGPEREVAARGLPRPIPAHPVRELSSRSSRRSMPLVGRGGDLELLRGLARRTEESRRPHVVTIVGEAGIGKSRLVEEFAAGLRDGTEVLVGRAGELGEDPALAPLAEMVRRRLGVDADAPPSQVQERLQEVVSGCCDPSESDRVAARLGQLLGTTEEEEGPEGRYHWAEIRAGLAALVEGLGRERPVVMVLEDLHLARPVLLDVVEELLRERADLPLLVVAVARQDLLRERPSWGGGISDALVLRLEPLPLEDATRLANAAAEGLRPETVDRIARQAGGNPFFIVETTRVLLHEREHHGLEPTHPVLAPTVQALVASRIDHLDEPLRALVRTASIFPGGVFQESKLELVADVRPEHLEALLQEQILVPEEDRPGRWRFRHELLREVAYESLSKHERRRLHDRVASGILAMEETDRHAQQAAHHLEQAALAARDLDPSDRAPARRAAAALKRAGDLARWRMESRAAIDLYERALALWGPEVGWGRDEGRTLAALGESWYWLGEFGSARDALERALDVAGDDVWTRAHAMRFLGDIALNVDGERDRAVKLFDQALAAARELDEPYTIARTLLMAGWVPYWQEDRETARAMFEEALAVARSNPDGDRRSEARALTSLSSAMTGLVPEHEVLELCERALAIGRELGDAFTTAVANQYVGNSMRRLWRLGESIHHHGEAVRAFRELGARWELASALGDLGYARRLAGQLDRAESDLHEALELCERLAERALSSWTAGELATVQILRGDLAAARALLDSPAAGRSLEEPGSETGVLTARTLLALAEGDPGEALRYAELARAADNPARTPEFDAVWVWWIGRLFGPDAAGGKEAVRDAAATLERMEWRQSLKAPDAVLASLSR